MKIDAREPLCAYVLPLECVEEAVDPGVSAAAVAAAENQNGQELLKMKENTSENCKKAPLDEEDDDDDGNKEQQRGFQSSYCPEQSWAALFLLWQH